MLIGDHAQDHLAVPVPSDTNCGCARVARRCDRPGRLERHAVPCGLDRPNTADDFGRGGKFLRRALDLHADLQVVIAVGEAAGKVAETAKAELARRGCKLLKARSPHHTDNAHRLAVADRLIQARLYAYPLGFLFPAPRDGRGRGRGRGHRRVKR